MTSVEKYEGKERDAIYQVLQRLEDLKNPAKYVYKLQTEIAVLLGRFLPEEIEKMLRAVHSHKYLAAIPMEKIRTMYDPNTVAVLPQTGWQEYDFGLAVANATSREAFVQSLRIETGNDYIQNSILLSQTGFILIRPKDKKITVPELLKDKPNMSLIRHASHRWIR